MTQRNDDNEDARDAHLLAALRHAPDRDALPPRELSERILAAARASVQPARESRAPWAQRLGGWLARPQIAAAFGTLAVASLVGVMWSTREPPVDEFVPNAPLADGAGRADQRSMAPAPALSAPAEAAEAVEADVGEGEGAAASAVSSGKREKVAAAPPPKKSGKDAAVRAESRARAVAETAPAAPAAPTTTAATPPAASAPPAVAAPARQAADAAAPAAAAERRSANESDLPGLAQQQGAAASRSASAATLGMLLAAKARVAEPLAAIDAALAAGARWQAAGLTGGRQHGEAQRALWASMKEATQGRWEAVQPAVPTAPWLVLEQGPPAATLWIMNGALHVTAQGQTWRAPVDAARLADWQAQVALW